MSGVWVVRTAPWVTAHPLLRKDVWNAIVAIAGVEALTDLEVITPHTLDEFLLPADQSLVPARTTRKRK
jgi:hypothetical protein